MNRIAFLTIAALCFSFTPRISAQEPAPSIPVVVTNGEAVIMVAPDRAFVTIAAESRSRNSAEAQRQNAEAMTAVMAKLEQAGVPKDAIRTIAYDLQPEF